ncbi:MAG: peptidoglycan-binding protein [Clostridia bacterium]|nr:peptidoglycan-binding protein [Clostridia bacterium]
MKKILKIAALTAVLALCLILTGCYNAPDDVNTGTTTDPGNALPFQTLAPTATVEVTPDTIVIETQNIFGGETSGIQTPTPTPPEGGGNGWNDWGTVQDGTTPTPNPTSSVIVFDNVTIPPTDGSTAGTTIEVVTKEPETPKPTEAPATPTQTPPSLQRGFTGSDAVRAVQKRLKELGYYNGSADGDFGPATEAAVKAFQKANGLKADGKVGKQTLAKMNAKTAVSKGSSSSSSSSSKTKTTTSPKKTAKPTPKKTNTPRPTATPNLSKDYYLDIGAKGKKVETLQRRLIELGWLSGRVTGKYDEATQAAVLAFQKKTKGLWEDGIAGPDTLQALYSSNATRNGSSSNSSGTSGSAGSKPDTLEMGSTGSEVRRLQQKLKDLGYLSGSADGSFGVATQAAVIAFQKNNNLTADGKAGTATQSKLYSGTARKATGNAAKIQESSDGSTTSTSGRDTSDIASTGYVTLEAGSESEQVKTLQKRLKELGYYNGNIDGRYGEETQAAVMAFQLRNNLTVDGKAGPATQRVLYGSKSSITYPSMRKGEEGTSVKNLQYTLYELGYYDGPIDGKYGQTTADAVRAFQIQNHLTPVDGVAGSKTLSRLYSSDAIAATASNVESETAKAGDRNDLVVQIQDCLVQLGFLDSITGVYDDATVAAVKAFQSANGLTPDGKCGTMTLQVLFGY